MLYMIFSISLETYSNIFTAFSGSFCTAIGPCAKRRSHRTPPSWNWVRRYIHRTGSKLGPRRPCWIPGLRRDDTRFSPWDLARNDEISRI